MWQIAAKYIGKKAAVKGIKGLISNSEGRKKSKEQLELEQEVEGLLGRSTFMTILMYAAGILFSYYIMSWWKWGPLLVLIGYLGHFMNLDKLRKHTSVGREIALSVIATITLAFIYLINFSEFRNKIKITVLDFLI